MARVQTGGRMPELAVNTQKRAGVPMADLLGGKRTVFWVLRYIGCTTCRYDVHLLAQRYAEFEAKGTQVYVVMQSDPQVVREETQAEPLPFEIICD
ncbi:MAG: redoxin domain-containing protein, partial [Oscillospiraceae bacterium]|nr:redoxin domain-containing protein [Oscillospiraceae bacterium]